MADLFREKLKIFLVAWLTRPGVPPNLCDSSVPEELSSVARKLAALQRRQKSARISRISGIQ